MLFYSQFIIFHLKKFSITVCILTRERGNEKITKDSQQMKQIKRI